MLNFELGVRIINRLKPIFTKDVNIIDMDGIIIASSNSERINTFHEAGRICVRSRRNIVITESNKHLYRGCREGVNMPLYYKNKIIGVIGITGTEKEVLPYGPLIKELIETIIGELENKKSDNSTRINIERYFREIINGIENEDIILYESKAKLLDIDLGKGRIMIMLTVEIKKEENFMEKQIDLKKIISNKFSEKDIIVINLYENRNLILIPNRYDAQNILMNIEKLIKQIKGLKYRFIVGDNCKEINHYQSAYNKISEIEMFEKESWNNNIIYVNDYDIKLLVRGIKIGVKNQYINTYKNIFGEEKLSEEMINTIKTYFINNMIISKTADIMFVHRNTISYRINRFKKIYGIDLTLPYECTKVYLAILIYEQSIKKSVR